MDEAPAKHALAGGPAQRRDGDDPDLVLQVTSDQSAEALAQLDVLEHDDSRRRAVVSVSMLKEGWDVKDIYVIAADRKLESELLTEQILGRGLRLPFGKRTGVGMLDTVEVLSPVLPRVARSAESLLLQTLGDRAKEAKAVAVTTPGVAGHACSFDALDGDPTRSSPATCSSACQSQARRRTTRAAAAAGACVTCRRRVRGRRAS